MHTQFWSEILKETDPSARPRYTVGQLKMRLQ